MEKEKTDYALVYDINVLPRNMKISDVLNGARENGICFWDSMNGGIKPHVVKLGDGNNNEYLKNVQIVDVNESGRQDI